MICADKLKASLQFLEFMCKKMNLKIVCETVIGDPQKQTRTRTFEPTNESADCWSTAHINNFIIRVK